VELPSRGQGRVGASDGWTIGRTGGVASHTASIVAGSRGSNLALRVQRTGADTSTADIVLVFNMSVAASRGLVDQDVVLTFRARMGADFSAASDLLTGQIKYSTNAGEQSTTSAADTYTTGDSLAEGDDFTLTTSWQTFTVSTATSPPAKQFALLFKFTPVGTAGAADYFEIEEAQIERGTTATDFAVPDFRLCAG
jgi:hypothetical protein